MHFFIIGFMGSGKTAMGKKLAILLNMPVIDLDEWIEGQEGETVSDMFAGKGEAKFRKLETEALYNLSARRDDHIIICGGGTSCSRENRNIMKRTGKIILIECERSRLIERLQKEKHIRPIISSVSEEELEQTVDILFKKRKECYSDFDFRFEDGRTDLSNFAIQIKIHE